MVVLKSLIKLVSDVCARVCACARVCVCNSVDWHSIFVSIMTYCKEILKYGHLDNDN